MNLKKIVLLCTVLSCFRKKFFVKTSTFRSHKLKVQFTKSKSAHVAIIIPLVIDSIQILSKIDDF